MGSLQIRGIAKGIHLQLPRIHPSNVNLQPTQQKEGPRFILVTHLHAQICLIDLEEFCFWYDLVLHLLWIDVVATNVVETV